MNRKVLLLALFSVLVVRVAALAQAPICLIKITEPREGQQVGRGITVKGTATIPPGHHLWVLARRENFADQDVWWPQAEGRIDPKTGEWKASASFGESRDIGWGFDLAVAVFKEGAHLELKNYISEAMKTGNWLPIEMPGSVCPPEFRKVKKNSDN